MEKLVRLMDEEWSEVLQLVGYAMSDLQVAGPVHDKMEIIQTRLKEQLAQGPADPKTPTSDTIARTVDCVAQIMADLIARVPVQMVPNYNNVAAQAYLIYQAAEREVLRNEA